MTGDIDLNDHSLNNVRYITIKHGTGLSYPSAGHTKLYIDTSGGIWRMTNNGLGTETVQLVDWNLLITNAYLRNGGQALTGNLNLGSNAILADDISTPE